MTVVTLLQMQMRFDGTLGFPGGLVEKGEDPVIGLNREMEEEIGLEVASVASGLRILSVSLCHSPPPPTHTHALCLSKLQSL